MHFVKIYAGITESSITDLEVHVRWLWIVMLTKADRYGNVYGTPSALARIANLSVEQTDDALKQLMETDPRSTSIEEEGRRILQPSPNIWHIVSYTKYRNMRDREHDNEDARVRMAAKRLRDKGVTHVTQNVTKSYDIAEADSRGREQRAEEDKERGFAPPSFSVDSWTLVESPQSTVDTTQVTTPPPAPRPAGFHPPTVDEVKAYLQEKGYTFDPEYFVAFYASKGWKVGAAPMKDWHAACLTWEKRQTVSLPAKPAESEGDKRAKARALREAEAGL